MAEQTSGPGNACCRLYADPSGTLRGAPSVERIVAALKAYQWAGPTRRQLPLALPALLVSLLPNLTLSSVLASLWGGTWCARVGLRVDGSLATSAYDSVPARCAVGLCGCGYCAPWLWSASHGSRCSIRVGYRQVFPELQHALVRRTCSADICIFLECVAARQQTRLCRMRAV